MTIYIPEEIHRELRHVSFDERRSATEIIRELVKEYLAKKRRRNEREGGEVGGASKHGKGMIYRRGNVWWIKFYDNGRPRYERSRSTKETDAKRLLSLHLGQVEQGNCPAPEAQRTTFEDLARDLENEYRANGRRSVGHLLVRIAHLRRFFGGMRAASISTAHVRAYIVKRQEESAKPATVNQELAALKRMFSLATEATPPRVGRVPHIPTLDENNARQGFFEEEAFRAVLGHLPEEVKPVATFAYITGWCIPSEVPPLPWAQVDFRAGAVRLEPGTTKNLQGRTFAMFPELRALVEAQRAYTERIQRELGCITSWVFHREGKPIKSFRRCWLTACRLAGQPGRIPHDFRRTAVRNMVRKGIPERVAMQLTGHKTRSVFERYNIVSDGDLLEAGRKLTGTVTDFVTAPTATALIRPHSSQHKAGGAI